MKSKDTPSQQLQKPSEKPKATKPLTSALEIINEKAHPNDLVINQNGKKIVITETELHKLLQLPQALANSQNKTQSEHNKSVSQYGFKSAQDMIAFLKSPANDKAKKSMLDAIVVLLALREQKHHSFRSELLRHLFLILFRLAKRSKKESENNKLNAAYQKQIEKTLAYGRAIAEQSLDGSNGIYIDEALKKQILEAYELNTKTLQEQLDSSLAEAKALENKMARHQQRYEAIEAQYLALDIHLQALDEHDEVLSGMRSSAERGEATQAVIKVVHEGIVRVTAHVQQHVANGEDVPANALMNHLDGLHVQMEGLKSILTVINSQKSYYDVEGNKTDSFKNAAYILDNQYQLYKDQDSGKLYLLKPGQDFANLTVDEKSEAQEKFEETKPAIRSIKDTIKLQKITDFGLHENKKQALVARSEALQKDILDLTNQCNKAKSVQASVQALLQDSKKVDLSKLPPVPKPAPVAKVINNEPKPQPISVNKVNQYILELIRFNPTQEAIDRFRDCQVLPNGQPNKAAQELVSNTLKANQVISPTQMKILLEGIRASIPKPVVSADRSPTPAPNKVESQKPVAPINPFQPAPTAANSNSAENQKQAEKNPITSPNPCKTNPSPK